MTYLIYQEEQTTFNRTDCVDRTDAYLRWDRLAIVNKTDHGQKNILWSMIQTIWSIGQTMVKGIDHETMANTTDHGLQTQQSSLHDLFCDRPAIGQSDVVVHKSILLPIHATSLLRCHNRVI